MTKENAAKVIDTDWKYSWHWNKEEWQKDALHDCQKEMESIYKRLERLKLVEFELAREIAKMEQ